MTKKHVRIIVDYQVSMVSTGACYHYSRNLHLGLVYSAISVIGENASLPLVFSCANQFLIIFKHIDPVSLVVPYRLMNDILKNTILHLESKGFMYYSLCINIYCYLFFDLSQSLELAGCLCEEMLIMQSCLFTSTFKNRKQRTK